jgi:hypothetical protein
MPFESKRKKLVWTSEEVEKLTEIRCSRTQPVRSVDNDLNKMPVIFKSVDMLMWELCSTCPRRHSDKTQEFI